MFISTAQVIMALVIVRFVIKLRRPWLRPLSSVMVYLIIHPLGRLWLRPALPAIRRSYQPPPRLIQHHYQMPLFTTQTMLALGTAKAVILQKQQTLN
jgi:hypothetical protein